MSIKATINTNEEIRNYQNFVDLLFPGETMKNYKNFISLMLPLKQDEREIVDLFNVYLDKLPLSIQDILDTKVFSNVGEYYNSLEDLVYMNEIDWEQEKEVIYLIHGLSMNHVCWQIIKGKYYLNDSLLDKRDEEREPYWRVLLGLYRKEN